MADGLPTGWIDWDRDKHGLREDIYVSEQALFEEALRREMWAPADTYFSELAIGRNPKTEDVHIQGLMRKPGGQDEKFVWDIPGERGIAGTVVMCD